MMQCCRMENSPDSVLENMEQSLDLHIVKKIENDE